MEKLNEGLIDIFDKLVDAGLTARKRVTKKKVEKLFDQLIEAVDRHYQLRLKTLDSQIDLLGSQLKEFSGSKFYKHERIKQLKSMYDKTVEDRNYVSELYEDFKSVKDGSINFAFNDEGEIKNKLNRLKDAKNKLEKSLPKEPESDPILKKDEENVESSTELNFTGEFTPPEVEPETVDAEVVDGDQSETVPTKDDLTPFEKVDDETPTDVNSDPVTDIEDPQTPSEVKLSPLEIEDGEGALENSLASLQIPEPKTFQDNLFNELIIKSPEEFSNLMKHYNEYTKVLSMGHDLSSQFEDAKSPAEKKDLISRIRIANEKIVELKRLLKDNQLTKKINTSKEMNLMNILYKSKIENKLTDINKKLEDHKLADDKKQTLKTSKKFFEDLLQVSKKSDTKIFSKLPDFAKNKLMANEVFLTSNKKLLKAIIDNDPSFFDKFKLFSNDGKYGISQKDKELESDWKEIQYSDLQQATSPVKKDEPIVDPVAEPEVASTPVEPEAAPEIVSPKDDTDVIPDEKLDVEPPQVSAKDLESLTKSPKAKENKAPKKKSSTDKKEKEIKGLSKQQQKEFKETGKIKTKNKKLANSIVVDNPELKTVDTAEGIEIVPDLKKEQQIENFLKDVTHEKVMSDPAFDGYYELDKKVKIINNEIKELEASKLFNKDQKIKKKQDEIKAVQTNMQNFRKIIPFDDAKLQLALDSYETFKNNLDAAKKK